MEKITNIKVWNAIDERIDRIVEQFELRNEELENRIKELENHNINNIIKRVEELEGKMAQNNTAICNETSNLNNKIDDFEAKYETKKIEGLELLYHLIKNAKMSYKQAVNEMVKHNQDMDFLNELELSKDNINLNEGGE
tara:strand:+ start:61 stop:477 length:417 start_codon:yes stop_codon:yes gene_type:complete